jgi:Flp pilus assembly protein CpaB
MAAVAQPLTSIRGFRAARRVNRRIVVASGLAVLSVLALLVGLAAVVPETQSLLQATRDLPAGTVVQPSDLAAVRVRVPDNMAQVAYAATASDQLVGHRVAVHVAAGEMLTPAQFATQHVSVAPGRVQLTIPVESYTASAGAIGPGDAVVVYASPRQANAIDTAMPLVQQARVVAVGRADQASVGGSAAGGTRPLWVTLDLDQNQAAAVDGASHTAYLDLALLATGDEVQAGDR